MFKLFFPADFAQQTTFAVTIFREYAYIKKIIAVKRRNAAVLQVKAGIIT
ncbi:hypothetical protein AAIR98_001310 [Elusimicrobium simillimum]